MQHKIAVLGYGGMGSWHAEKLATLPELFALAGTFDIRPERQAAARGQGMAPYDSFEAMLEDPALEIVTIATPNDLHRPLAEQLMAAGKHVISEKPATLCCADLEAMTGAAEKHGRLFTVHQNRRWDEDFLVVKQLMREKRLGPVFRVESRVQGSRGIPGDWRNKKAQGGGMLLDWGVHLLDQLLQLDESPVVSVYAQLQNVTNEEVDDGFVASLEFESGLQALVEVGTSHFIALPRWYVTGENGSAVVEDWNLNGKIVMVSDWEKRDAVPVVTAAGLTKTMAPRTAETIREYPLPRVESDVRDFYRNVASVLEGGAEPLVTHRQQRRLMQLMETVLQSGEEHRSIRTRI